MPGSDDSGVVLATGSSKSKSPRMVMAVSHIPSTCSSMRLLSPSGLVLKPARRMSETMRSKATRVACCWSVKFSPALYDFCAALYRMNATAAAMAKIAEATIISIRLNPRSLVCVDFMDPCTLSSDPPPPGRRRLISSLESHRRQGHRLRPSQLVPAQRHGHLDADAVAEVGPADLIQPGGGRAVVELARDLHLPRRDRVGRAGADHRLGRVRRDGPEGRVQRDERQLVERLHDVVRQGGRLGHRLAALQLPSPQDEHRADRQEHPSQDSDGDDDLDEAEPLFLVSSRRPWPARRHAALPRRRQNVVYAVEIVPVGVTVMV